ncbi:MAG: 3-oxoacyl-ACP synthase [Planctomycetes bacterium]|jgi:3-oxoacyl-[acyl-carrier-protein] synthase-3|nr:3-oxoacyl-ACP synthase [Planctomycetota bacterium]MDP6410564.1 beta-ketoacyl-ACP synthase III [Planctomycetota bacterium]
MSSIIPVGIAGIGSYAPERVVPNAHFEEFLDTSDEWIVQRTGIKERRFVAAGENTSHMCLAAARKALEAAGVTGEELDMIIVGTVSPDQQLPAVANLVQVGLGATKAACFDVNAACTGFLTSLVTAESFIAAGRARRVLVLGAETLSRFIDFTDRGSCILFGDGAGAAVLMPHADCGQGEILRSTMGSDGEGYSVIEMPAGGSGRPASHETVEAREHFLKVHGRDVYRFAVAKIASLVREMLEGHTLDEVSVVVPHQVNRRIIDSAVEKLDIPPEKVVINIDRYGNTSAASVPLALDEALRDGRIEKDKLVIMAAFGAGLSWGGALVRW